MSTKMLEAKVRPVTKGSWRKAFGAMKDDDLPREAMRLGDQWRAWEDMRR